MGNFVKIDRKILEWEWWDDFNTFRLFFYMLVSAYWKDGYYKGELIERGSFPSSISKLASETGLTDNEIRNALKHLKSTGEITSKSHSKYSVFTIKNYNLYQSDNKQKCDETTSTDAIKIQSDNEQITNLPIIKEVKNIRSKEDKNIYIVSNDTICQTQDVRRVVDKWNELEKYGIASIKKLTSSSNRYRMLNARIKQFSLDDVLTAIENIKDSSFLQGKSDSRRPWVITFDWFVKPNNFPKVLEGQYSDKKDGQNSSGQKSVTDMQLEQLAERQKQSVPIMSDEEINKMFGE